MPPILFVKNGKIQAGYYTTYDVLVASDTADVAAISKGTTSAKGQAVGLDYKTGSKGIGSEFQARSRRALGANAVNIRPGAQGIDKQLRRVFRQAGMEVPEALNDSVHASSGYTGATKALEEARSTWSVRARRLWGAVGRAVGIAGPALMVLDIASIGDTVREHVDLMNNAYNHAQEAGAARVERQLQEVQGAETHERGTNGR